MVSGRGEKQVGLVLKLSKLNLNLANVPLALTCSL